MATPERRPRYLMSDDDLWMIVCHPERSAPDLARQIGTTATAVRNARMRFRREGWSCRIDYRPCAHCGGTVAASAGQRSKQIFYHRRCRPAALAAIQHRLDSDRWETMTEAERAENVRRKDARERAKNARAFEAAHGHRRPWQQDELDRIFQSDQGTTDLELALELGRTVFAVRSKRQHLQRRQDS